MDESAFQRACGEFVSREVYCCVSTMAEYILKKAWEDRDAPFSNEDIENIMQSAEFDFNGKWYDIWSPEELEEWKNEQETELYSQEDSEIERLQIMTTAGIYTETEMEEFKEEITHKYATLIDQLQEAYDEAESQLGDHKEILEYWIVSPYLLSKLQERNEAVIESEQIWCRCTSGQAIAIDGVIREIVKEQLIARSEWDEEAKQILL